MGPSRGCLWTHAHAAVLPSHPLRHVGLSTCGLLMPPGQWVVVGDGGALALHSGVHPSLAAFLDMSPEQRGLLRMVRMTLCPP